MGDQNDEPRTSTPEPPLSARLVELGAVGGRTPEFPKKKHRADAPNTASMPPTQHACHLNRMNHSSSEATAYAKSDDLGTIRGAEEEEEALEMLS